MTSKQPVPLGEDPVVEDVRRARAALWQAGGGTPEGFSRAAAATTPPTPAPRRRAARLSPRPLEDPPTVAEIRAIRKKMWTEGAETSEGAAAPAKRRAAKASPTPATPARKAKRRGRRAA